MTLLAALLAPAALAGAGPDRPARHAKAKLLACDTDAQAAVFRGVIRRFGKARSLQLRFTLQARATGDRRFKRVVAPSFDEWLTSSPGRKGLVYDKAVQELAPGTTYRVRVRFRWRDRNGEVVARATKATPECEQPDDRPNLRATRVLVRPGTSKDTRTYFVRIVNRGREEAPAFAVGLTVDGAALGEVTAGPLPGATRGAVAFLSPRCRAGSTLTASVDTGDAVDERNESDNRLAVPCPTRGRAVTLRRRP